MGDFNWDCIAVNDFWRNLMIISKNNSLACNDLSMSSESFTYLIPSHNTVTWIDHAFSSKCMTLQDLEVLYAHSLFDYFPISFVLDIPYALARNCTSRDKIG